MTTRDTSSELTRVDRVQARWATRTQLRVVIARQDVLVLKAAAAQADVSLHGWCRRALDAYLIDQGLPRLSPLKG